MKHLALWVLPFLVSSALGAGRTITVAADGSGDFKTVTEAVDAVPANNTDWVVVHIKPGTYKEKLRIPHNKSHVIFRGDDATKTVLTYDQTARTPGPDGKPVGTTGSTSVRIDADDFVAENITFENSAGDKGQAVALKTTGDRQAFRHCRMIGWQDTLYADGVRNYFGDCYIEGRVDFIFGKATAVFDHCEIHSMNGGFVTAASTHQGTPYGYVFLHCKLTGEGEKALLGRPWRPYAAVIFAWCEIGPHIAPAGWENWSNAQNEKTARYAEYHNTGPGADRSKRVPWAKELTDAEAKDLTVEHLLGGTDHWDPTKAE